MGRTTPLSTLVCEQCSQEYVLPTAVVQNYARNHGHARRFCGRACMGAASRAAGQEEPRSCERCEAPLFPIQRVDSRGRRRGWHTPKRFCSLSCSAATKNEKGAAGWLDRHGYRVLSVDGVGIPEHRLVMEKRLGRKLFEHETVHHKNGMRSDNDESNLELWSGRQPGGQRVEDKIDFCIDFLRSYGFEVSAPGTLSKIKVLEEDHF